ncbi:hypothetical protein [Streptomyces broussonetiae]|uniref:Uncharacterized protein n=1 Tax=Streptomyces broussonetiae TaxID=2686304 RepID=A0ABV5EIJ3_9ACTN
MNRGRSRAHLTSGGPTGEQRRAAAGRTGYTRSQQAARAPLLKVMAQLAAAVDRRDWRAARTARSAAWAEADKLADYLTREELSKLGEYRRRILAGEARDRRPGPLTGA